MSDGTAYLADFYIDSSLESSNERLVITGGTYSNINFNNRRDFSRLGYDDPVSKLLIMLVPNTTGAISFDRDHDRHFLNYKDSYLMVFFVQCEKGPNGKRYWLYKMKPGLFDEVSSTFYSLEGALVECRNILERFDFESLEVPSFENSIKFLPEHKQAGLQILGYFQETLNQKYPDNDVKVEIGQKGNIITMKVETHDGNIDEYEKAFEDYGLVITGKKPTAKYLDGAVDIIALENQLRMAEVQLKNQFEILRLKDQIIDNQRTGLDYFQNELSQSLMSQREVIGSFLENLKRSANYNDMASVFQILEDELRSNGAESLKAELTDFQVQNPDLWKALKEHLNNIIEKAVYTGVSKELLGLLDKI